MVGNAACRPIRQLEPKRYRLGFCAFGFSAAGLPQQPLFLALSAIPATSKFLWAARLCFARPGPLRSPYAWAMHRTCQMRSGGASDCAETGCSGGAEVRAGRRERGEEARVPISSEPAALDARPREEAGMWKVEIKCGSNWLAFAGFDVQWDILRAERPCSGLVLRARRQQAW